MKKISLKINIRVQLQQDESAERFAKQLWDIGNGKMKMDESTHCIPRKLLSTGTIESSDQLIAKVFRSLSENFKNNKWVGSILAAKNIDVNSIS